MSSYKLYALKREAMRVVREVVATYGWATPQWLAAYMWQLDIHTRMVKAMVAEGLMED